MRSASSCEHKGKNSFAYLRVKRVEKYVPISSILLKEPTPLEFDMQLMYWDIEGFKKRKIDPNPSRLTLWVRFQVNNRFQVNSNIALAHHSIGIASMSLVRFLPTNSLIRSSISVQPIMQCQGAVSDMQKNQYPVKLTTVMMPEVAHFCHCWS